MIVDCFSLWPVFLLLCITGSACRRVPPHLPGVSVGDSEHGALLKTIQSPVGKPFVVRVALPPASLMGHVNPRNSFRSWKGHDGTGRLLWAASVPDLLGHDLPSTTSAALALTNGANSESFCDSRVPW